MGRLFGTDGVRGLANVDLTADLALALSAAAATVLTGADPAGSRPVAVVGRDPRASGEFLEAAVVAGLAGAGVDVVRVGVVPTPAVAYLTTALQARCGVMLSASHNPMPDNGIKFFDRDGYKLPDEVEEEIERECGRDRPRPTGADVGRVRDQPDLVQEYVDHLLGTLPHPLTGLSVVVDCANGSASALAPRLLREAGAEVHVLAAEPDGLNINVDCGSTHPDAVGAEVRRRSADVGIAHDGDADRCLAVDAAGELVDGDQILAICAADLHRQGQLAGDAVATTVMANLGFRQAMAAEGIRVQETAVGDRYVLAAMRAHGIVLGGEQSGHLVFLEHATTGDGMLTAVQLLGRVARTGRPLSELAAIVPRYPQVLRNVAVSDRERAMSSPKLSAAVADAQSQLGADGRLLVRPSGTEPVVRVMVEARSADQARRVADVVAAALTD